MCLFLSLIVSVFVMDSDAITLHDVIVQLINFYFAKSNRKEKRSSNKLLEKANKVTNQPRDY